MQKFNFVDINSPEFEVRILEIFSKNQVTEPVRFLRLDNGWIKDLNTNLEWGPTSSNEMNLNKAKEYCQNKGGRLPTLKELQGLVDYEKYNPTINKNFFSDTKSTWYWTTTQTSWRKDAAWCVSFGHGDVYDNGEVYDNYVRPVRASQ